MKRRTFLKGMGAIGVTALAAGTGFLATRPGIDLAPGKSRARSITGDTDLPHSTEVVIIGGGFVGVNAALTLAERGIPVVLCEKGVVAGEASGRSMGFMNGQLADAAKTPMISRSKQLWAGMNARTGTDSSFRPTGAVLELSEEQITDAEQWIKTQSAFPEFDYRIVTGRALEKLLPGNMNLPHAALFSPSDGSVDASLAVPALAEVARARGAKIIQNCAVREIEFSGGAISGVVTENGRIACRNVIVAGGYWSPLLLSGMGLDLPQIDVYLSQYALSKLDGPEMPYQSAKYGIRRQTDGSYTFGVFDVMLPIEPDLIKHAMLLRQGAEAFGSMAHLGMSPAEFWDQMMRDPHALPSPYEKRRILNPEVRTIPMDKALNALSADYPEFRNVKVMEKWAGVISTTPDNMPFISDVPGRTGLLIGSGLEAGLSWGPAVGEALADLAMGRTTKFDLKNYRFNRFSDGSPMVFRH